MKVLVWIILCLIWGSTWIFIKIGLEDLPPITFAAARFVLAIAILFPLIKLLRLRMPSTKSEWKLVALTGFFQFSLNYSSVFWAEQFISSGLAAVLQATITIFGLVLAWIFLPSERITPIKVGAVLIGVAGVGVIFADQLKLDESMAFVASLTIAVGAYFAAQASILVKAKGSGMNPAVLVFTQMLFGLPAILIYAFVAEGNPANASWTPRAIFCVVYLSIFGTIAAFWLYYWLLSKIESTKAMMISLVTPLVAVVIGNLTLGEKLPPQTIVGSALILFSIALIVIKMPGKKTGT